MKKAIKTGKPPPLQQLKNKNWAMIDSGSEPTIANCSKIFPDHPLRTSEAQRRGVRYVSATGDTVKNEGEVEITHRDPNIGDFNCVVQNADVHCPIISVRQLVKLGCRVLFTEHGGVIKYKDGRRLRFVLRGGVFFFWLNVVSPNQAEPVFSRQDSAQ